MRRVRGCAICHDTRGPLAHGIEAPAGCLEIQFQCRDPALLRDVDEPRRRIDRAAGADRHEEVRRLDGRDRLVHAVGDFAEPDDIRAHGAGRPAGGASVGHAHIAAMGPDSAAGGAEGLEQAAMNVDHVRCAALFMQIVDILGNQRYLMPRIRTQSPERMMGRIGHCVTGVGTAHGVEIQHPGRIARISLRRCHLGQIVLRPQPVLVAKCSETGFSGNTRACENSDLHGCILCVIRLCSIIHRQGNTKGRFR